MTTAKKDNNDLTITRVAGSATVGDQNIAANVTNIAPETKFSSLGVGAYLDVELAKEAEFNAVAIGFFRGSLRKTKFSIAQTNDFKEFKAVEPPTFVSSETDDVQTFPIKKTTAKGIRISFEGNALKPGIGTGPINGVAITTSTLTGSGKPNATGVLTSDFASNTAPAGTLTYTDNPNQYKTHASPLGVALPPNVSDTNDLFEISHVTLLNTDQDKETEKAVNEQVKAFKDVAKDAVDKAKDLICVRCGKNEFDNAICKVCGIKGDYIHHEPPHIKEAFPTNINITGVHQSNQKPVDTTPSATQPPQVQTRPITTTQANMPAQSGNTIIVGTEVIQKGNISTEGVDQLVSSKTTQGQQHVTEVNKPANQTESAPPKQDKIKQQDSTVASTKNNKIAQNQSNNTSNNVQQNTNNNSANQSQSSVQKSSSSTNTTTDANAQTHQNLGWSALDSKGKTPTEQATDAAKDNKTLNTSTTSDASKNNTARVVDNNNKSNTASTNVNGEKVNTVTSTTTTIKDKDKKEENK